MSSSSSQPPDGGRNAWLAVAGAWCGLFVSFGWITCMGVFQAHYQNNQLSTYSPGSIGWIPSVETFFLFVGAPFFGKLFDSYGPRYLLIIGSLFHVFGLMMVSLCQEYYQFFLAQSVCSALGAGAIFWASNNSVGTWFQKRRGFALGIVSSGSSVGGVVGTAAIPPLISRVGFSWAMRITAFLYLALLLIAIATLRSRLNHKSSKFYLIDLVNPLRDWYVCSLGIGGFLFFLGVFLPYNYLVVEAVADGMRQSLADSLLVIMSTTSILGRVVPGWAGDRFGRFNVTIAFTFVSSIFVLAIWTPSSNDATRIAFSALYGFSSGTFVSMIPTLIAQICPDIKKLGIYMGAVYLVMSPSIIISQPLGGALSSAGGGNMTWMKVFCGLVMGAGGLMFVVARSAYTKHLQHRGKSGDTGSIELQKLRGFTMV